MKKIVLSLMIALSISAIGQVPFYGTRMFISPDLADTLWVDFSSEAGKALLSTNDSILKIKTSRQSTDSAMISIESDSIIVLTEGGKGLVYGSDYSSSFTSRSIPDQEHTSNMIKDSLDGRSIVATQDGILDWQTNRYMPYTSRGTGVLYNSVDNPNTVLSGDSTLKYDGNFHSYSMNVYDATNGYKATAGTATINVLGTGILMKSLGKNKTIIRPSLNASPFVFNTLTGTTVGTSDELFGLYNNGTKRFKLTGGGRMDLVGSPFVITNNNHINSISSDAMAIQNTSTSKYHFRAVPASSTLNFTFNSSVTVAATDTLFKLYNNSNDRISMTGNGNLIINSLESDLGKYQLTINSTTKEIYAQELAHAFYGFADSSTNLTLTSNATWYHVTNPSKNLWTNYEDDYVSISNDTITLINSAHWEMHYHVVFTGSTGVWFKMRLYNVTKGQIIPIPTASTGQGTNYVSIGNTAYCTACDTGDKIVLQMISESNSQTVTLIDGSILIKATHGTK